jgi:hypothetical protein
MTTAAQTAKAIRTELKEKFPGTKFSVTSSNFAGGNSVDISWTDGPTRDTVEAVTKKYQYGNFNGMIDLYEYSNSREDIPQAKYVQAARHYSPAVEEATKAKLVKEWGMTEWSDAEAQRVRNCWTNEMLYREMQDKSF